jgi:hypothetical protein
VAVTRRLLSAVRVCHTAGAILCKSRLGPTVVTRWRCCRTPIPAYLPQAKAEVTCRDIQVHRRHFARLRVARLGPWMESAGIVPRLACPSSWAKVRSGWRKLPVGNPQPGPQVWYRAGCLRAHPRRAKSGPGPAWILARAHGRPTEAGAGPEPRGLPRRAERWAQGGKTESE